MFPVVRALSVCLAVGVFSGDLVFAQDEVNQPPADAPENRAITERVEEFAEHVDQDARAQEAKAGILRPIFQVAEFLAFPGVHWVAFALMVAGVVSFSLQLVLAKLIVLFKMGLSFTEVLSDALGLAISVVGLVLTTQAAAKSSNFAESAAMVLSATIVGAIVGLVFYWWGQSQELHAVEGRKK